MTLQAPAHVPLSLTKHKLKDKNYYEFQDEDCEIQSQAQVPGSVLSLGDREWGWGASPLSWFNTCKSWPCLEAFINF